MEKQPKIVVCCLHCDRWFETNDVPMPENLDLSQIQSDFLTCPHCQSITGYDQQNVKIVREDEPVG